MSKIRFEAEVEIVRLYTVPIFAESLTDAAARVKTLLTAAEVEELGDSTDHEINVVGVSRQTGRKMYQ